MATSSSTAEQAHDLVERHARLRQEMIDQLERTAALENHWLMYMVWGWLNFAACVASHFLVEAEASTPPYHWALAGVWLAQIVAALLAAKWITGEPRIPDSPLQPYVRSLWIIFLLLTCDVAVLTLVAQQPVRLFLPFLATVSSFLFLVLGFLFSRRFIVAALTLFITGSVMASLPRYSFLIYGVVWLIVLQTISVVFQRKRSRWRADARAQLAETPEPEEACRD